MNGRRNILGQLVALLARGRGGVSPDETADWLRAQLALTPKTAAARISAVLSSLANSGDQDTVDPDDALQSVKHLTDEAVGDILDRYVELPRTTMGISPASGDVLWLLAETSGKPAAVRARTLNDLEVSQEEIEAARAELLSGTDSIHTRRMTTIDPQGGAHKAKDQGLSPDEPPPTEPAVDSLGARVADLEAAAIVREDRALELEARIAELQQEVAEARAQASPERAAIAELRKLKLTDRALKRLVAAGDHGEVCERLAAARQHAGLDLLQAPFECYQKAIGGVRGEDDPTWTLERKKELRTLLNAAARSLCARLKHGQASGLLNIGGGGSGSFQLKESSTGKTLVTLGQTLPFFRLQAAAPTQR